MVTCLLPVFPRICVCDLLIPSPPADLFPIPSLSPPHIYQPSFPIHFPDQLMSNSVPAPRFLPVPEHSLFPDSPACLLPSYFALADRLPAAKLRFELLPNKRLIAFSCSASDSCLRVHISVLRTVAVWRIDD